jgi:hypothetical protein
MKWNYIIMFMLCLLPMALQAQEVSTTFYTSQWKSASPKSYAIKRIVSQTDSGYIYTHFNKKGKLRFSGEYASIDPELEHGKFSFYTTKGNLRAQGTYTRGEMTGIWKVYSQDGALIKEANYDIPLITCAPFDSASNSAPGISADETDLEVMPVFQDGNVKTFYRYLYEQLLYPPLAEMYFRTGRVIGYFTIDREGTVCNVYTAEGVDKDLRRETLRVLSLLPVWQPGRLGGRPVSVKYTCPLVYSFE